MLNERMAPGRHSGVMMWPGGNFNYQNTTPTYIQSWDPSYNFKNRIDTVSGISKMQQLQLLKRMFLF